MLQDSRWRLGSMFYLLLLSRLEKKRSAHQLGGSENFLVVPWNGSGLFVISSACARVCFCFCCRWKIWLFTWKRKFWRIQPYLEMKTLGPLRRTSALLEKVGKAPAAALPPFPVTKQWGHHQSTVTCVVVPRPGWHIQPGWLHHLSGGRWNSAVCLVALPGICASLPQDGFENFGSENAAVTPCAHP